MDGLAQLVIEVPSHAALPRQDPRVVPASLTFTPYHHSSLHGDWLPRINVPLRADKPRGEHHHPSQASPTSPVAPTRPLRLTHVHTSTYEEGPPSPTQVPPTPLVLRPTALCSAHRSINAP